MRKSLSDEFGVFFRLILVCVCVLFLFSHVTEMLSHLSIVLLHVTHIELLCFRCLVLPSVFVCVCVFFSSQSLSPYRIACTHTLHIYRKSFGTTFRSLLRCMWVCAHFYYHCYDFLFFILSFMRCLPSSFTHVFAPTKPPSCAQIQ